MTEPRATVLVIDDMEVLRECMAEELQGTARFQVVVAATCREGLGLLVRAERTYDVVVVDCRMPVGVRALGRLRQARPDLPVVAVSADPGRRQTASNRGAPCWRRSTRSSPVASGPILRRDTSAFLPAFYDFCDRNAALP